MFSTARGLILLVACVTAVAAAGLPPPVPVESAETSTAADRSPSSRDLVDDVLLDTSVLTATSAGEAVGHNVDAVKDVAVVPLVDASKQGHGHKPVKKIKKKKPLGKHKKKKQTFKDKLLPLLLIPFVIQTMLIPFFIMNLKFLALKAMAIGKFAILLISFNMFRSWQQNAHSTSITGTPGASLMAQNYGFSGVPEFGALFSGR